MSGPPNFSFWALTPWQERAFPKLWHGIVGTLARDGHRRFWALKAEAIWKAWKKNQ